MPDQPTAQPGGTCATAPVTNPNEKRYAFWKYDLFPYLLSGEVGELFEGGIVKPTNYSGHRFHYTAIINGDAGKQLGKDLERLREEHRQATAKLNADFKARRNVLLAAAGLDTDGKPNCLPQCSACCTE